MGWSPESIWFSVAAWAGALLLAGPLPVSRALALPLERAVRVAPGATCLEADELVEQIAHRLGSGELDAGLSIEVRGSESFARFVEYEVLQAGAGRTQRRFEPGPADCEDLHAALGLAIALTIKAAQRAPRDQQQAGDARADTRPWQLGAAALVGLLVPPGAGYGGEMYVQGAFARRFAGRLGVLGIGNPQRTFAESPGSFDVWLLSGHADACALPGVWAHATLATCLGFAFGALLAQGDALAPSTSASRRMLGLEGALELAFALRRAWSLRLALNVLVPLEPTSFVVRDEAGTVVDTRELSVLGGFVSLGPTYNF